MRIALSCVLCVAVAGCGKGAAQGAPASGVDVDCPSGQYVLDGGCAAFPGFSDAAVVFDRVQIQPGQQTIVALQSAEPSGVYACKPSPSWSRAG